MLLNIVCLAALVSCASIFSLCTGNNVIKISLKKYHKYGELSLENLQKHVEELKQMEKENGVVPLHNFADLMYYGEMSLGTPPQTFNMLITTYSADCWVMSKDMCSDSKWKDLCSHHTMYDKNASSTFKKRGRPFSISGDMIQGNLSQDTMTIGNMTVPDLAFGEVRNLTYDLMTSKPYDGVCGMAYPNASQLHVVPFIMKMFRRKTIPRPEFFLYLTHNSTSNSSSELVLGGVDPTRYEGNLTYTNVTEKKYFFISINGVTVGNESVTSSIKAMPLSGSSFIVGPKNITDRINNLIGAKPYYSLYFVDCNKMSSMPNITINIGGTDFVLRPEDYVIKLTRYCISSFLGLFIDWIGLGVSFLRAFVSAFDMGKNMVGFAPAK